MNAYEFCYWLQGFFELTEKTDTALTSTQTKKIANHLDLVFVHDIDPATNQAHHEKMGLDDPAGKKLQEIHDKGKSISSKALLKRC